MKTKTNPIDDLREIVERAVVEAKQNASPDSRGYEHGDGTRLKKWRARLRRCVAVKAWLDDFSPPTYSELGPVWVAQSYETTDECAPESRTAWRVADLDDYIIASDMTQSGAEAVARALNYERGLRLLAISSQSLYWWAHEAWETVYAQTCHDPELTPSWLPELKAVLDEFDAANRKILDK